MASVPDWSEMPHSENLFCYVTGGRARRRNPRPRRGRHRSRKRAPGSKARICRYANFWLPLQTRCRTHAAALLAFVMGEALGSRPVPGTPSGKRSAGTHRAIRVVCMPSERTARAAQLAPSAVTASAVGGSATRSVVGRVSPRTSGSSNAAQSPGPHNPRR